MSYARPNIQARRGFLRNCIAGTTTTLALPWLQSLSAWADESGKQSDADDSTNKPPLRFGCLYFSNGVEPEHWWAKRQAGRTEFGQCLTPLQDLADDVLFIKGLFNPQAALHPSPHMGRMANLLSGAWISNEQSEIRAGKSMDQVLAEELGRNTDLPSLVLGVEPTELRLEDGLSMIYGSCISWASDTRPATKEIYPARVYDLIVGGGKSRELDRSILDALTEDARRVRRGVSADDRNKLDEYLESIRDIEIRIDRAQKTQSLEGWRPSASQPTFGRPEEELPQNVAEHMRLMLDLIVLAFQMDKTRIATCMLNNDLSQMNFGFLEGVEGSLHLDLTHNGRDPKLESMYLRTNQFHVQQLRYLMDRMQAIDEGGSSLLDNSLIMLCSNLFDGDRHQADEMPVVLAGRGSGSVPRGGIIDLSSAAEESRRACNLYLSIMQKMGLAKNRFGDSFQAMSLS
ncbi:MAG: DUF1552 domain-containing protein [Planctomycetales bacterium]|nr:DUF1552 domain-containing protein [Planctomycetales bacterium]